MSTSTTTSTTKAEQAFSELAQVIKEVIDDAISKLDKENNLIDKSNKRCAFCGAPNKVDVVIPRGRRNLLVCMECYTSAKAIMDTNHRWV